MNHTDWIFDFSLQAQLAAGKKRFNLDVNCQSKARRLAIIGPSGSGKSLTLQLLAGFSPLNMDMSALTGKPMVIRHRKSGCRRNNGKSG